MRRLVFSLAALFAGFTTVAAAQNPPAPTPAPAAHPAAAAPAAPQAGAKLSDYAGTWDTRTMAGPKDSVLVNYTLAVSADGKTWTLQFPNRDPIASRVLGFGGDSVMTETGPFQSVLRPGQMVTTWTTGHYHGKTMTGTFEAHYASGDVLKGKVAATRR